ncbi:sensor histidine kinase [Xylanibacter ruminicola]|jgi:signal transduction histidine kinase|uniref:histidine kinase n=1 Tax=Xylanibacter ruminicola TaxID=839 RepID=A0A1M6REE9_XYLRU|nr:HAMP domain-containing sensor histidine kinase [Xylanibacter ruminicola]SHK30844.1 Signal transduction histidine kinase [Xylanibacter ruminicola]
MKRTLLLLNAIISLSVVYAASDPVAAEQMEMLQRRSQFTNGGIAMVVCIGALLVFLVVNNRWQHRLEVKNLQLQRERNVVVAQNKQLAIERDRAEAALQAKTAFLRSMTHEIRTPLNAINGFTQVLTMTGVEIPEAERLDFSQRIQENTRLLTNILDDLILISDTESGADLPDPEQCIAASIITQARDTVEPIVAKGVELKCSCMMPETEMITTRPHMINLILTKLLDNAAKFTTRGSITISMDKVDDKLHFAVADTGPGIPCDKRDYIFERFSKLDSFMQGAGLGLSIARMIAERLGGTLTLDASYVGGSKFDLIIPIDNKA